MTPSRTRAEPGPAPIWPRDFRLLWSGSAASQLGTISAATASPLLALSMSKSPVFAGWVTAASTIPGLLLHLPAGLIVDRVDRRLIMMVSQFVRCLAAFLLVAGLLFSDDPTPLLIVALIITAVTDNTFAVFYNIAEITAVRHVVPAEMLKTAMARNEARHHIALLFGRPLGGLLFALGRSFPYAVDALTSLLSVIALSLIDARLFRTSRNSHKDVQISTPQEPVQQDRGIRSGLLLLRRDTFLRTILGACAIANFFFQTIILLLVFKARQDGLPSSLIGLLLASSGIAGLLGAAVAPRVLRRFDPQRVAVCCVVGWLPLILVVALSGQPAVGLVAWGCCSFMGAHLNVALAIYQAAAVPGHLMGRAASINRFLTSGAVPLGALSAGYVIAGLGPHRAALLAALAFSMVALSVPLLVRPRRSLRRPGGGPAPDEGPEPVGMPSGYRTEVGLRTG
ncbi:MAG TPA: MFS transporter [Streptosporangiaceae bacterium]|nr:MFS transporter [Streptosporangiaceae bacterium]